MKTLLIILTSLLLMPVAYAQPKPLMGYTYKVDGGMPGKEVYISAQQPYNASGNLVGPGDLTTQTRQVFDNLKKALAQLGMTFRNVTQVTYHFKGAASASPPSTQLPQSLIGLTSQYFTQGSPRLTGIKNLPRIARDEVLVEVEVIAVK